MAGIDVGHSKGRRASNHDIPLIPFIDFLLCLVMFLLVTAVWSQMARLEASANVPGTPDTTRPPAPEKVRELHVEMRGERAFKLVWREGSTVVHEVSVARREVEAADGDISYPELAQKIEEEWKTAGSHRAASDKNFDRAILHADNSTEFSKLVAVLDAINQPEREFAFSGGKAEKVAAFQTSFASD